MTSYLINVYSLNMLNKSVFNVGTLADISPQCELKLLIHISGYCSHFRKTTHAMF